MNETICTVIVTFNRKDLLLETIEAVITQNRKSDAIIIVDNASTDGTDKLLDEKHIISLESKSEKYIGDVYYKSIYKNTIVYYLKKKSNTGGAGGFYTGLKFGYENNFDMFWIMDDDVIPDKFALFELEKNIRRFDNIGYVCSRVISENGDSMNIPKIDLRPGKTFYPDWEKHLELGLIKIIESTFVSLLIPAKTIEKIGFPIPEMFIWGDDSEYTRRITQKFEAYLIGTSKVVHKRKIQGKPDILTETNDFRLKLFYYQYRNKIFVFRKYDHKILIIVLVKSIIDIFKSIFAPKGLKKIKIIYSGIKDGFEFNPKKQKRR